MVALSRVCCSKEDDADEDEGEEDGEAPFEAFFEVIHRVMRLDWMTQETAKGHEGHMRCR